MFQFWAMARPPFGPSADEPAGPEWHSSCCRRSKFTEASLLLETLCYCGVRHSGITHRNKKQEMLPEQACCYSEFFATVSKLEHICMFSLLCTAQVCLFFLLYIFLLICLESQFSHPAYMYGPPQIFCLRYLHSKLFFTGERSVVLQVLQVTGPVQRELPTA